MTAGTPRPAETCHCGGRNGEHWHRCVDRSTDEGAADWIPGEYGTLGQRIQQAIENEVPPEYAPLVTARVKEVLTAREREAMERSRAEARKWLSFQLDPSESYDIADRVLAAALAQKTPEGEQ